MPGFAFETLNKKNLDEVKALCLDYQRHLQADTIKGLRNAFLVPLKQMRAQAKADNDKQRVADIDRIIERISGKHLSKTGKAALRDMSFDNLFDMYCLDVYTLSQGAPDRPTFDAYKQTVRDNFMQNITQYGFDTIAKQNAMAELSDFLSKAKGTSLETLRSFKTMYKERESILHPRRYQNNVLGRILTKIDNWLVKHGYQPTKLGVSGQKLSRSIFACLPMSDAELKKKKSKSGHSNQLRKS